MANHIDRTPKDSHLDKRRHAIAACIVSAIANHPHGCPSEYEIRKYVMACPGFDWARPIMVSCAIWLMSRFGRIVSEIPTGHIFPRHRLPDDPTAPFRTREERLREFDRTILDSMYLPKFFRINGKEDLRPHVKQRTGYDIRVDYARY